MDVAGSVTKLLIEGYVIVPGVIIGPELDAMREGFESLASRAGKRHFTPEEILTEPALVNYIAHPRLMPVIDAFMAHFGHEPAIAWLHLCRDIFNPAAPPPPPFDVERDGKSIWMHNDGAPSGGGSVPLSFDVLDRGCATFVFMDDADPDAGCLVQAPGTHHLSRRGPDGGVISPHRRFIRDHCRYVFPRIRAGDALIQRAFNFHAVGPPPRRLRRTLRADYTPMALFHQICLDGRRSLPGVHQAFPDSVLNQLPVERHRYFCRS